MSRSGSSVSSIEIVDDDFAEAIASSPTKDAPVRLRSTSKDGGEKSPAADAKSPASTRTSSSSEAKSSVSAKESSTAEAKSPAASAKVSSSDDVSAKASSIAEAKNSGAAKDATDAKNEIRNAKITDSGGTPGKPSLLTKELMGSLKERTRSEDSAPIPIPKERSLAKDPVPAKSPTPSKDPISPKDPVVAKSPTPCKSPALAKDPAPSQDPKTAKAVSPSKPAPSRSPPESPSGSADVSDGSGGGIGAGIPRRPMGPRSRRPPTQLLAQQRESDRSERSRAQSEVLLELDETGAADVEAETAAPAPELPADEPCEPVSEAQDEEAPAARPRFVPKGAVPLMMPMPGLGRGGGGGMPLLLQKSRVARQLPPSDTPAGDPPAADAADVGPVDGPDFRPKLRSRPPPGAVGIGPQLPSAAGTDFAALRQQLRKTVAPSSSKEPLGPPPPLPPKPGAGESQGAKPSAPPRPPPPKAKPRGGKTSDNAKLSASPE